MADHGGGGSVRHRAHVVVTLLGLAGLVALTLAVLAPSTHPVPGAETDGTVGGASVAATSSSGPSLSGPSTGTTKSSTSKAARPRTLVALGDSVPSADTCGCTGYVEQVGERLDVLTHRSWVVHNDAAGGWRTSDVETDLSAPATRAHLADADLVLIEVGANDFDLSRVDEPGCLPAASSDCWTSTLEGLRAGLTRIVDGIRRIDVRPDLRVVLFGYWNVAADGKVGRAFGPQFVLGSDQLTRLFNTTVQQVATRTGAEYADAYTPLKGDLGTRDPTSDLLQDGDHPNASGHALLAAAVVEELSRVGALAGWTEGSG